MTVPVKITGSSIHLPKHKSESINLDRIPIPTKDVLGPPINRNKTFLKGQIVGITNPNTDKLEYKSAYIIVGQKQVTRNTKEFYLNPTNSRATPTTAREYNDEHKHFALQKPTGGYTSKRCLRKIKPNHLLKHIDPDTSTEKLISNLI